jgi:hypothetical protein
MVPWACLGNVAVLGCPLLEWKGNGPISDEQILLTNDNPENFESIVLTTYALPTSAMTQSLIFLSPQQSSMTPKVFKGMGFH